MTEDCPDHPPIERIVKCPTCGGDSVYAASNSARPFCSDRCKNMDLGAWASENFRVQASAPLEDSEADSSNLH